MIRRIHLSIVKQGLIVIDYTNENTDVIVEMKDGEIYVASFFTYKNIATIIEKNKKSGEFLSGKYFWVQGLVLIDKCEMQDVVDVINDLIEEGDFQKVFRKL